VIFRFIAAKKAEHSIKTMCHVLGVSRSGFHAWQRRPPSARALQDERLTERIREIHNANRKVYGSPRIHAELRLADGVRVARKRVERLMRQAGITGMVAKKRGRTTIRVPGIRVCDDLVDRAFLAAAPNRLWVADITYLRTWEGWLYLVAVQDVYSRRIVGWSMADHMRTELVTDALQMALAPTPAGARADLALRSGQPVRLAGLRPTGPRCGIAQSMGSRGDCFDNAVAESFFATLKKELIHGRSWPSKAELRTEVFEYIEVFFNRRLAALDARLSLARAVRDDHPPSSERTTTRLNRPCPPKRGSSIWSQPAASPRTNRSRRTSPPRPEPSSQ
jgi:putative transposase